MVVIALAVCFVALLISVVMNNLTANWTFLAPLITLFTGVLVGRKL
jgi:hypothetical protein